MAPGSAAGMRKPTTINLAKQCCAQHHPALPPLWLVYTVQGMGVHTPQKTWRPGRSQVPLHPHICDACPANNTSTTLLQSRLTVCAVMDTEHTHVVHAVGWGPQATDHVGLSSCSNP
jgi:hypothetical protein